MCMCSDYTIFSFWFCSFVATQISSIHIFTFIGFDPIPSSTFLVVILVASRINIASVNVVYLFWHPQKKKTHTHRHTSPWAVRLRSANFPHSTAGNGFYFVRLHHFSKDANAVDKTRRMMHFHIHVIKWKLCQHVMPCKSHVLDDYFILFSFHFISWNYSVNCHHSQQFYITCINAQAENRWNLAN